MDLLIDGHDAGLGLDPSRIAQVGELDGTADIPMRRAAAEVLAQRLFSILLAVHAAQANLVERPGCLPENLELIRTQSAASLEDLHGLFARQ